MKNVNEFYLYKQLHALFCQPSERQYMVSKIMQELRLRCLGKLKDELCRRKTHTMVISPSPTAWEAAVGNRWPLESLCQDFRSDQTPNVTDEHHARKQPSWRTGNASALSNPNKVLSTPFVSAQEVSTARERFHRPGNSCRRRRREPADTCLPSWSEFRA